MCTERTAVILKRWHKLNSLLYLYSACKYNCKGNMKHGGSLIIRC